MIVMEYGFNDGGRSLSLIKRMKALLERPWRKGVGIGPQNHR